MKIKDKKCFKIIYFLLIYSKNTFFQLYRISIIRYTIDWSYIETNIKKNKIKALFYYKF